MLKKFFILLASLCLIYNIADAHPGRTDSNGGHWNRSTGTYHYHNGSSSGRSSGGSSYLNSKSTPLPWQDLRSELSKSSETTNVVPTASPEKSKSLNIKMLIDFAKDMSNPWVLLSGVPLIWLCSVFLKELLKTLKEKRRSKLEKKEAEIQRRAEYEKQRQEKERLLQEEKERKHAEWLKRREEAERKAAEYQAIVDERRKQQELEYEERKRKREEQKQNEIAMFQSHSIKELSGMPEFAEIGSDGLPKVKGEDGWGEYFTRYYYSPKSHAYHKKSCRYAKTPYHVFVFDWHIKAYHACSVCNPEPKPSDSWFKEYKKLKTKCIRYGIKPIPDD